MVKTTKDKTRCEWCGSDPMYVTYHDTEWGVPCHDDQVLFEFLILEGAQAGLSWITVLKKRENYRQALADFDPAKVAKFSDAKLAKMLENPGIIRNKLKVASHRQNAKAFLAIQKEFGSFDHYLWHGDGDIGKWQGIGGKPIVNRCKSMKDIPAKTELSDALSKDLKKRGFNFVGSTIMYAYMQAVGMVNDHVITCFRY